jgi:hypothetical protein
LLGAAYLGYIEDQHGVGVLVVDFLYALVEAVLADQEVFTFEAEIHQTAVATAATALKIFVMGNLLAQVFEK